MPTENDREFKRNFNTDDSIMMQHSRTLRGHFNNNIAPFTDFDPSFDAAYSANWLALIDECQSTETDETVMDQLGQYTEDLEKAQKEGFEAAAGLEYYVKLAFPGKKSVMDEFGFTERKKARNRTVNILIWLSIMKKVAETYTAELAAVGMPAAILTNLDTKTDNAVHREIDQEFFKRKRIRALRERVEKMNRLYAFSTRINNAAQVVFYDDAEHRGLFNLS